MAQKIRDSGMPPGAQEEAFRRLQSRKQMFEFGKEPGKELARYNAQVHAAVEQRTDEIVQATVRSDDAAAHAKAQQDLANIVKWGADTGAIPPDKAAEFERKAKASLITGRAQYLDARADLGGVHVRAPGEGRFDHRAGAVPRRHRQAGRGARIYPAEQGCLAAEYLAGSGS